MFVVKRRGYFLAYLHSVYYRMRLRMPQRNFKNTDFLFFSELPTWAVDLTIILACACSNRTEGTYSMMIGRDKLPVRQPGLIPSGVEKEG